MGLSFHDKESLDESVGNLRFASDPPKPNSDTGSNDIDDQGREDGIVNQARRKDDIDVEHINEIGVGHISDIGVGHINDIGGRINDIEMVDRCTVG